MITLRKLSVGLLSLGLVMSASLIGCDRRVSAPVDSRPPTPVEPKTDAVEVVVETPGGVTVSNLRIGLVLGNQVVRDTTAASVTHQQVLRFGGLDPGTYIVVAMASGYQVQQSLLSIVDMQIPRAVVRLRTLATDAAQTVVTQNVTDPNVITPFNIVVPSQLNELAPGMSDGLLEITGSTGNVTAILSGQGRVPSIRDRTGIIASAMSAVGFQIEQVTDNTSVTVTLPVPVEPVHHAAIAGQPVDVYTFNFTTLTWRSIGTATIGANGTVSVTLTGTSELGENNLIAIGKQPTIGQHKTTVSTVQRFSPMDLDGLRDQGVTTLSYDVDPYIVTYSATGKQAVGLRDTPPGIPHAVWGLIAPYIGQREPDLIDWVYDGDTVKEFTVPIRNDVRVDLTRRRTRFNFNYNWGGGVVKRYEINIEFTGRDSVIVTIHEIQAGGGQ